MREPFADVLVGALANMTSRLLDAAPKLSALGVLVGLGAVGAWAVAGLAQAALRAAAFDRSAIRWGLWRILQAGGIRRSPTDVLAGTLGAATFALAALIALDGVEVPGAGSVTGVILHFLPRAVGGVVLLVLGSLAGRLGAFGTRLTWARLGWARPDLAGKLGSWLVKAATAGLALAVLGVPPLAILIAPAVPAGFVWLGASLGIAQVAQAQARRAAVRWVRVLWPSREPVRAAEPAGLEEPATAITDVPGTVGRGVKAFARFHSSRE